MRRLTVAFLVLISAAVLAACGDTGDHFGEFRQATPGPTSVKKLQMVMPIVASQYTKHAVLKLYITAYNGKGEAIPQGTTLANPITLHSNWSGVTFTVGGKQVTSAAFGSAPATITVTYSAPKNPCNPIVGVIAFNQNADPQTDEFDVVDCPKSSPSPSSSPTGGPTTKPTKSPKPTPSPTPVPSPIVKKISLSMPTTPNPLSPGTFTMVVTAFGPTGAAIKPGTTLVNPIQLTSNSSCSVSFASSSGSGTSVTLANAPGSVTITYSPPSTKCTPPTAIVISAFDVDASPQTAQFSILGGTATVTGVTLSFLTNPDITATGVYPLFVAATGSGGAIPFGESLTNPIQFSSNSCAVTFGTTTDPATFTSTYRMSSTQTQVYVQFAPSDNPTHCTPAGGTVTITSIASGGVSQTINFPY